MDINEHHGRKGKPQEYYEFTVKIPRFVAQRQGAQVPTDFWFVCRCDPDGCWRTLINGLPEHEARVMAYKALQEWLSAHCAAFLPMDDGQQEGVSA